MTVMRVALAIASCFITAICFPIDFQKKIWNLGIQYPVPVDNNADKQTAYRQLIDIKHTFFRAVYLHKYNI